MLIPATYNSRMHTHALVRALVNIATICDDVQEWVTISYICIIIVIRVPSVELCLKRIELMKHYKVTFCVYMHLI